MHIGLAQFKPVWLNKGKTIDKICEILDQVEAQELDLIAFPEAFVPGYPFWLSFTDGSRFESDFQKELHAHYMRNAVQPDANDLSLIGDICKERQVAMYLGTVERASDRGGHSLYCSLIYIDKEGIVQSVHRKLQPTYEERLSWSSGDGNGLQVHNLEGFQVGGLNCWENWMPLVRSALYAQGENLHIAVWPGSVKNTEDITRFIARESRSYVVSVSSYLSRDDIGDIPHSDFIREAAPQVLADGGSCVAAPDGSWLLSPQVGTEGLFTVEIDLEQVLRERQNFDPSGHYSRPDVTHLEVNRERQRLVSFANKELMHARDFSKSHTKNNDEHTDQKW